MNNKIAVLACGALALCLILAGMGSRLARPEPAPTPEASADFAPIAGKTLVFSDDFSGGYKKNWNTWFPFRTRKASDPEARRYARDNQPWFATDPDYSPDLPATIELLPGGGVRLNTLKNPRPRDPRFQAFGKPATYLAGVLVTRDFQRKVGSYTEYDMTISRDRGSFSSGWSWDPVKAEEIDTFEQVAVNPDRLFWAALKPAAPYQARPDPPWSEARHFKDKQGRPTPMVIGGQRVLFGTLWTPAGVEWFVNRQSRGFAAVKLTRPQNLIVNNVVGGWDGNDRRISDHTSVIVHSVRTWQ